MPEPQAQDHIHLLTGLGASPQLLEHASTQPSLEAFWDTSPRGDHLLWLAAKLKCEHKALVRATVLCAKTALPYANPETAAVCARTLGVVSLWCAGMASAEEVQATAQEASRRSTCADGEANRAAAEAADAAARTAILQWSAPWAAAEAEVAATWAAWVTHRAVPHERNTTQAEAHKRCADIVRVNLVGFHLVLP